MSQKGKRKEFSVEWPEFNVKVTATLLEDKAPKLCKQFWESLPYESHSGHVFVAGESGGIGGPKPFIITHMENPTTRDPGTFYVYRGLGVSMPYGHITEPTVVNKFAQINAEDLKKYDQAIKKIGKYAWRVTMTGVGKRPKTIVRRKE